MSEKENVTEATAEPVAKTSAKAAKPAVTETTKPVEATPAPTAITLPEEEKEGKGLASVGNGAIGSTTVKAAKKVEPITKADSATDNLVAVFSTKNYHWDENGGSLKRGYNIVEKAAADKWVTLEGVRAATPEEVATAFKAGN